MQQIQNQEIKNQEIKKMPPPLLLDSSITIIKLALESLSEPEVNFIVNKADFIKNRINTLILYFCESEFIFYNNINNIEYLFKKYDVDPFYITLIFQKDPAIIKRIDSLKQTLYEKGIFSKIKFEKYMETNPTNLSNSIGTKKSAKRYTLTWTVYFKIWASLFHACIPRLPIVGIVMPVINTFPTFEQIEQSILISHDSGTVAKFNAKDKKILNTSLKISQKFLNQPSSLTKQDYFNSYFMFQCIALQKLVISDNYNMMIKGIINNNIPTIEKIQDISKEFSTSHLWLNSSYPSLFCTPMFQLSETSTTTSLFQLPIQSVSSSLGQQKANTLTILNKVFYPAQSTFFKNIPTKPIFLYYGDTKPNQSETTSIQKLVFSKMYTMSRMLEQIQLKTEPTIILYSNVENRFKTYDQQQVIFNISWKLSAFDHVSGYGKYDQLINSMIIGCMISISSKAYVQLANYVNHSFQHHHNKELASVSLADITREKICVYLETCLGILLQLKWKATLPNNIETYIQPSGINEVMFQLLQRRHQGIYTIEKNDIYMCLTELHLVS